MMHLENKSLLIYSLQSHIGYVMCVVHLEKKSLLINDLQSRVGYVCNVNRLLMVKANLNLSI